MKHPKTHFFHFAAASVANAPLNEGEIHTDNKGWKKQIHLPLFVFLMLISGKIISQALMPQPLNNLPLYQDGKLYFQMKLNSNVVVNSKDDILNDPAGTFKALFTKYDVVTTERPYAVLNTPELNKTYLISFNDVAQVDDFIRELSGISSDVALAEKVPAIYKYNIPPNEFTLPTAQAPALYHLALLNANQAAGIHISTGGAVVAIVDDAVLTSHEDLNFNMNALNQDVTPSPLNASNPNPPLGPTITYLFTHGTHVAGIAGARTDNAKGVASIGWNIKIMGVKTSNIMSNGNLLNPYTGVAWAAANGAHVINMSWGGAAPSIIDYTVLMTAKNTYGAVLVAAAGNSGSSVPNYPAAYGEGLTGQTWEVFNKKLVVAVAALDQNNNISVWGNIAASSFGSWVDIAAYGTDIMSTLADASASGVAITNKYGLGNGTSMAAPMVAGIAGLMHSYAPAKTADQIIDCLINTANPDIYNSIHPANQLGTLGSGRADAWAALRCLSSNCAGNPVNNPVAIIVPNTPNYCTGTPVTLTANQGVSYLWNTGATTQAITTSVPGTYQVTVNFGGCTSVASINTTPPTLSLSQSINTSICPGSSVIQLSATGSYGTLVWQPGGMTTNAVVVFPIGGVATYTATANGYCGGAVATIAVTPLMTGPPIALYTQYSVLGPNISGVLVSTNPVPFNTGHYILSADAVVNGLAVFNSAEIVIAPNVKLTVPSLSTLDLNAAYLHTCGADMWKGIVVENAGTLNINKIDPYGTLIEDAVTAVSSSYNASMPPNCTIRVSGAIFNKNYTDISLTDFNDPNIVLSDVLKVNSSVFTCRNFGISSVMPYLSTPNPDNSNPSALRYTTPANLSGQAAPYLNTYPSTTLKNPYTGQTSRCAIFLSGSGASNGASNNFIIGDDSDPNYFNVFDKHSVFVNSQNSNVALKNNVFQNQLHGIVPQVNVTINPGPGITAGGWSNNSAAVMHRTFNSSLSTRLDMSAANTGVGNRFWDCVRAVEGYNLAECKMSYGLVRSTHTFDGPNIVGASGLNLKANRVNYDIHDNEFSNIKNAINVPLTAGYIAGYQISFPSNVVTVVYGNYLTALAIYNNHFNSGNTTIGNFMNQAVNVTNDLNVQPNSPSPLPQLAPLLPNYGWVLYPWQPSGFHPTGLGIINNQINGAWNGINVNGFTGFPVWVAQNDVTLVEKPSATQYGIQLGNGTSTAPRQQSVWLNKVKGAGNSGANLSLIYCSLNSGNTSPIVNCNDLKDATKGFVFAGNNIGAPNMLGLQWRGNRMENLKFGMRLDGYLTPQSVMLQGIIGQQGDNVVAMGNYWNGSTWTGTNYNIWTESSQAINSPLYHVNSPLSSLNLSGNPPAWSYGSPTQVNSIIQNSNNDFFCDWTQYFVEPNPGTLNPNYDSDLQVYLVSTHTYHYLRYNQSVRDANNDLQVWYNGMKVNSNLEALELTQESLYRGDYSNARARVAAISAKNYVEENSMAFYNLYANYVQSINEGTTYTPGDSLALAQMAQLCAIEYGSSIYKARALYNSIYGTIVNYEDCNGTRSSSRQASTMQNGTPNQTENWGGELYPNPASNKLIIKSTGAKDDLTIRIFDMTGRVVLLKQLKTENFISVVDLDLANGAYVTTITNAQNQVLTKKLLIAK